MNKTGRHTYLPNLPIGPKINLITIKYCTSCILDLLFRYACKANREIKHLCIWKFILLPKKYGGKH